VGRAGAPLDLLPDLPCAETQVTSWSCADGSVVDAWHIINGVHGPTLSPSFAMNVVDFMYARKT